MSWGAASSFLGRWATDDVVRRIALILELQKLLPRKLLSCFVEEY